ncbi:hypothetical protein GLAREA_07939 [Glarea lozoyensis ATCC 20868]|uniref:Uncharacterized protein n=1 Tax=Glarea lozoyensis (strain ATCC 20868 / MF5171) TaxID=1116229 RepID=S3D6S4_GLAL2|nr:uncharacterized protein GLAREA_07939 [Glarea lozoyensis ATCC 20868]EPE32804.1 hypothetical protein GLAREA_07939 [Glarea lozoyensis ATCC 20868]
MGETSSKAALTSGLPGDDSSPHIWPTRGRLSHLAYPVMDGLRACATALGCGRGPNGRGRHPKHPITNSR